MRIWGIPEEIETLSADQIRGYIEKHYGQIHSLNRNLAYASGGAYSQDLNRIDDLLAEVEKMRGVLKGKE